VSFARHKGARDGIVVEFAQAGSGGAIRALDSVLDNAERAISEGVREMACWLNRGATSFEQTAQSLARAAHLDVSKETLRQLIEQGKAAECSPLKRRGALAPDW
jgi:hypothetical protein